MNRWQIVLTGDYQHPDFVDVLNEPQAPLTLVPLDQLRNGSLAGPRPSLVIIASSRRGQLNQAVVEQVWRWTQPSPVVGLHGSWCEGELRSGHAWQGVPRVYWHQWRGRFSRFLNCLETGQLHPWQMPRTTSVADALLLPYRESRQGDPVVGILSRERAERESLADALTGLGWQPVALAWPRSGRPDRDLLDDLDPAALLIASAGLDEGLIACSQQYAHRYAAVPQIAVLNFPRWQDRECLRDLGVARLVSKPFELAELQDALGAALAMPERRAA